MWNSIPKHNVKKQYFVCMRNILQLKRKGNENLRKNRRNIYEKTTKNN